MHTGSFRVHGVVRICVVKPLLLHTFPFFLFHKLYHLSLSQKGCETLHPPFTGWYIICVMLCWQKFQEMSCLNFPLARSHQGFLHKIFLFLSKSPWWLSKKTCIVCAEINKNWRLLEKTKKKRKYLLNNFCHNAKPFVDRTSSLLI